MSARVLVVDDDALMRRVLGRSLERLGHAVEVASDGDDALRRIREGSTGAAPTVDLMLLDVEMPVMDGVATLTALADEAAVVNLPVIVVSGVDEQATVVRCLELGAIDYLHKPFDVALLDVRVRTCLAAKRVRETELDHLEQIGRLIDAARALEGGTFTAAMLDGLAARDDELGDLGRTFRRMADEVATRERALRDEVASLRIRIDRAQRDREVARITGSAYYQRLTSEAEELKRILHARAEPDREETP